MESREDGNINHEKLASDILSWIFCHLYRDIILELYRAVHRTPFLWLDDVYVTGFLAANAGNISHYGLIDVIVFVYKTESLQEMIELTKLKELGMMKA